MKRRKSYFGEIFLGSGNRTRMATVGDKYDLRAFFRKGGKHLVEFVVKNQILPRLAARRLGNVNRQAL